MRNKLFVTACLVGAVAALIGGAIGTTLGKQGLLIGGALGGLLAAPLVARLAVSRGWIPAQLFWSTTAGAAFGFLMAGSVAMNTLTTPIGPVLSLAFIGAGAVVGSSRAV